MGSGSPIGVVGNVTRDLVRGEQRVGGGVYYAGRALRSLGRRGVLVTKCAEADRRELLTPLAALGMPVLWRSASTTMAFAIEYDGDTRALDLETVGPEWTPDEIRDWVRRGLGSIEWVHVAALSRGDFPLATVAELARGRRLLLDGHGLVRPKRTGLVVEDADFDRDTLRYLSVLKLSEGEAELVAGGVDPAALGSLGVPEVVVTLGSRGAIVVADGALETVRARPAGDVDPTGAGDAFAAVYLAARASGYGPAGAARRATVFVADFLARGGR